MRAAIIKNPGREGVVHLQQVEDPTPSGDEVAVRVHATALNRADLLQRRGLYPPPPGIRADIAGLEFSGVVSELGSRAGMFSEGDRVMGLLPGGGHAEKVVLSEQMALPIPEDLSFEEAAAIPEAFITAYDALMLQLKLDLGKTVLIHSAGSGVGTAAIQLARTAGCTAMGTAGTPEKLQQAEKLGLEWGVNYKRQDFAEAVLERTGGRGVDAILDTVGGAYLERNIRCLAPQGRMVVLGLLGGSKATLPLSLLLSKRIWIGGTVLRSRPLDEKVRLTRKFGTRILPLFSSGRLRPVIDRVFPLEAVSEAHEYMEANRNFGKIVLKLL